jgi:hypothetical protein
MIKLNMKQDMYYGPPQQKHDHQGNREQRN